MTRRRKYLMIALPPVLLAMVWWLLASTWGLTLGLRLATLSLPGKLSVTAHQGSLLGPLTLRGLHYQNKQLQLTIRQLDLTWRASALFTGKLQVKQLAVDGVDLTLAAHQQAQTATPSSRLLLPLTIELQQAAVRDVRIHTAVNKTVVINAVQLAALFKRQGVHIEQFQIQAYQADGQLKGDLQFTRDVPLSLDVAFRYQPDTKHALIGQGRLQGDLRKLQLRQRLSGMLDGELEAQARDVVAGLRWQGQLKLKHLDLHRLMPKSPAVSVMGSVHAEGDSKTLQAKAELQLDDKRIGRAQLHLQAHSDLAFTAYRMQADGRFSGVALPDARLALQASGDRRHLDVTRLDVDTLKGNIQGQASLSWTPQLLVDARLALKDLDTGMLMTQWPGKLSAQLAVQSEPAAPGRPVHFTIRQLSGELRGYPMQGELDGRWAEQQLRLDALQLNVAGAHVSAQGRLAQTWDMQFHAQSDNLNRLSPLLRGQFDLNGRLHGNARAPRLTLNGTAAHLAYAREAVASLSVQLDLGLAAQARSDLDLQATDVQIRNVLWKTLQLQTRGTTAAHTINLTAMNDTGSLHTQLQGNFVPWRWTGILDQFELNEVHYGKWRLQEPVALTLARGRYTSSSFCLIQDHAHLCLLGLWSAQQRQATLDIRAFPLHLLQSWLPPTVQLSGALNAKGEVTTTSQGAVRARLNVNTADKSVVFRFVDLKEQVTLAASTLTAQLDSKGLHAALHLPLSAGGGVESDMNLPGWSPQLGLPRSQPLLANLKLDRIPADLITRFVPETARAQGQLQADLHVSGSLGEPRLRGNAIWQGGSVLVPQLGINIRDVSAELKSTQTNTVAFSVKARSGDGDVQLDGQTQLNPAQGWPTQANLVSHNLEVSNIPEALIRVDSQIRIALQGSTINVDGDITVPRARLRPHSLPEGAVPVSPDIVIVHNGKLTTRTTRWLLTAHLRVQLGDQVDFNGFGIRGKLRGRLVLNDEPGKLILGQGEVSIVNGVYRLRGQDLTIRRGRLIFSNTFIDDPALDVEAVRVVSTVTAGVRLKGTLKQPQLTIFSEPTMSESDALAYLLLGHAFSSSTLAEGQSVSNAASALGLVAGDYLAKGIGGTLGLDELRLDVNQTTQNTALVLGKYLSPKLYLRYYSGIAESSRILQLQYQLSKRLQLQTESGYRGSQSITGGDIFFTVEY